MKIGEEAKAHEISKTQKGFGQILTGLGNIKIINIFNGVPKSKLRKNKILMGTNIKRMVQKSWIKPNLILTVD